MISELVVIKGRQGRFEIRRIESAERSALELASSITKEAKEKLAKAESLFQSAAAMDPAPRQAARAEAVRALQAAFGELSEILVEFRT
jgi:hypothetical protein